MTTEEKRKAYLRKYYQEHKEEYRARHRKWAKANLEKLRAKYDIYRHSPVRKATMKRRNAEKNDWLRDKLDKIKSRPCVDCGGTFPTECMDFDHVRGEKLFCVSKPNTIGPGLDAEIAKCDVVCANCHRIRTFSRKKSGG